MRLSSPGTKSVGICGKECKQDDENSGKGAMPKRVVASGTEESLQNFPSAPRRSQGLDLLVQVLVQRENASDNIKAEPQAPHIPPPPCRVSPEGDLEYDWTTCMTALMKYKVEQGSFRVPKDYVTRSGIPLGMWVDLQLADIRKWNRGYRMSLPRRMQLETLTQLGVGEHELEEKYKAQLKRKDNWEYQFVEFMVKSRNNPKHAQWGERLKWVEEQQKLYQTRQSTGPPRDTFMAIQETFRFSLLKLFGVQLE
jgi:hypothetical protein